MKIETLSKHEFERLVDDLYLLLELDEEMALKTIRKKLKGLSVYDAINILDMLGFDFISRKGNYFHFEYSLSAEFQIVKVVLECTNEIVKDVKVYVKRYF